MEKQSLQKEISTKAKDGNIAAEKEQLTISGKEAAEYTAYKRAKKVEEIMSAMAKSVTPLSRVGDAQRVCSRAERLKQASVKVTPAVLGVTKACLLGKQTVPDCIVGGTGETLLKVKVYEGKQALRKGAKEITLIVTPSLISDCRYSEIRKEIKKMRRVVGKAVLKVWVDKTFSFASIAKVARLASECGADFFSVPCFPDFYRLKYDVFGRCKLEVSGVENLSDFRKTIGVGVERIVTEHIWEIYTEWMREVEKITFPLKTERAAPAPVSPSALQEKGVEKGNAAKEKAETNEQKPPALPPLPVPVPVKTAPPVGALGTLQTPAAGKNPETDYCCRLEGGSLKFF